MAKGPLLVCVVALAAGCGGATKGHSAVPGKFGDALAYSRCMRSHGVPDFPDPKQVDGSIQISGPRSGTSPTSASFVAAQRTCSRFLPDGAFTRASQRRGLERMLRTARCMRAHGVARFPDPTLGAPASRSDYSEIMSNGIAWLAIPDSVDVRSPAFEHAAAACNLDPP